MPGYKIVDLKGFTGLHHEVTTAHVKKYGRIHGTHSDRYELLITDADLIRDIMVKDFHIFPNRKMIHLGSSLFNEVLFFLPGDDKWKRIRSIVTPAFTTGKLKRMSENMHDIGDNFVKNIAKAAEKGNE